VFRPAGLPVGSHAGTQEINRHRVPTIIGSEKGFLKRVLPSFQHAAETGGHRCGLVNIPLGNALKTTAPFGGSVKARLSGIEGQAAG